MGWFFSFLEGIFSSYRIPVDSSFLPALEKMLCHFLLISMFSNLQSFKLVLPYKLWIISLIYFRMFFVFTFQFEYEVSQGRFLWETPSRFSPTFFQIWGIFSHYFLKYFFSPTFSYLSFWDSNHPNAERFLQAHLSQRFCSYFFQSIFYCSH